jgi:hypothetical protein
VATSSRSWRKMARKGNARHNRPEIRISRRCWLIDRAAGRAKAAEQLRAAALKGR